MALLRIAGADRGLLVSWADAARAAGFDAVILPTGAVIDRPVMDGLCLWDLGPGTGVDLMPARRAMGRNAGVGFVFLSARPDPAEGLELLRAGARGYANRLLSNAVLGELLDTVSSGQLWAGHQVNDYLLARALSEPTTPPGPTAGPDVLERLSGREAEVAARVAAGASNKVIASDMGITERTVKAHLHSIFRKTAVRNRVQLALALAGRPADVAQRSSG